MLALTALTALLALLALLVLLALFALLAFASVARSLASCFGLLVPRYLHLCPYSICIRFSIDSVSVAVSAAVFVTMPVPAPVHPSSTVSLYNQALSDDFQPG